MTSQSFPIAITDGDTILATMDLPMTPDRVFAALNTREVEQWWGSPDTYRMTQWTSDLRVGGKWSAVPVRPDGMTTPASGEFLEIDKPRKIVLTRKYDWDFPGLGRRATTVTYRCDPIPDGTRLTIRHDGFAGSGEAATLHAQGWKFVLTWLHLYATGQQK